MQAESFYKVVAQAIAGFRHDKTIPNPRSPETEFNVKVKRKPVEHFIRLKRVTEWAQFGNIPQVRLRS